VTEITVGRGLPMMGRADGYRGLARGLAVSGMLGAALAAVTSCSAGQPAALPKASCGQATTHNLSPLTQVFRADTGALPCFATAARQCLSGSIAITEMGVDTGTDYIFAIVPGKPRCQATEWSQYYSANGGSSQGDVVVTGCSATARPDGVLLGCDGQSFLIPLTVTT
jgi:hypothetical protein